MSEGGWFRRLVNRSRPAALGLRRRILLIFTLGSLLLSVFLATTTYGLTRSNVVRRAHRHGDQHLATQRAGRRTRSPLAARRRRGGSSVARPASASQDYLIWYDDTWSGGGATFQDADVPPPLVTRVIDEGTSASQIVRLGDELNVVVGWDIPGIGAYFEAFSLDEADSTLSSVRLSLILAAAITTGLGILLGIFSARRAVRPVGTAAQAASAIAGGRLDTRLETTDDPDLRVLTESFNDMAEALQQRVERDARFASDVSHELRSPLMTLSASVEVMEARRDELPERSKAALDLLSSDVARFQGLVEDLLEISRFDAGAIRLHMEELLAAEFVRQAVAVSSLPDTPVHVSERAELALIRGDRRRLARVVANLIDNARAVRRRRTRGLDHRDQPRRRADVAHPDRRRGSRPRRRRGRARPRVRTVRPWRWRRTRTGSEGAGLGSVAGRRARPDARRTRSGSRTVSTASRVLDS